LKALHTKLANNITNPEVVRVLAGRRSIATRLKFSGQVSAKQRVKAAVTIDALASEAEQTYARG